MNVLKVAVEIPVKLIFLLVSLNNRVKESGTIVSLLQKRVWDKKISIFKTKNSWFVKKNEDIFSNSFIITGKENLKTSQEVNQIKILEIIEEIIKKIDLFPEIDLKKEILDIFSYFQNEILKKEEELKNTREKYIEKRDLFLKKVFEEEN